MRSITVILLVLGAVACSKDASAPEEPVPTGTATVNTPGFSFSPFTTNINVGQTVIFDIGAEPHNVIFGKGTGAPADIPVVSNRRISRTFNTAGTFPYDCTLHPGMSGTVVAR